MDLTPADTLALPPYTTSDKHIIRGRHTIFLLMFNNYSISQRWISGRPNITNEALSLLKFLNRPEDVEILVISTRSAGIKKAEKCVAYCPVFEWNETSEESERPSFLPKYPSHIITFKVVYISRIVADNENLTGRTEEVMLCY